MARLPVLALTALAWTFAPTPSRAEMASLFGLGSKSQGMGGTALLQGQYSPYQVYSAPAALGYLRRVEFAVGAQYMAPDVRPFGRLVLNSNGSMGEFRDAGVLPGGGSLLAFAVPLGRDRPVTLAGALYLPFTTLIRVSGTPVDHPFYPLFTDISRNFFFVVGAGYELAEGWALGLNLRSTTKSTVSYVLQADSSVNYSASATEARGENRLSYSLLYDNSRRHPHSPWTAGLMYRGRAGMETKITADISSFVPVQGSLTSLPSYTPAEWVVMGSWQPRPCLSVSADVARALWSRYSSPYGSGNINSYAIGDRLSQASFHDITVLRFGVEQKLRLSGKAVRALAWREGYQFHPSPVPNQTGDSNFVDNDRHMFSLGFGLELANPWREGDVLDLDLFFQYNLLKKRQVSKSSASKVGAPGYLTGGNILLFGLGAALRF